MMIIYAIIVLGVLIFVHELGHFLVAKLFNVKVEKFSLGFGAKLVGWKKGETEYLISVFPLGGYVKMFGEGGVVEGGNGDNPALVELSEEDKKRSFAHKPPLARIAIVVAGPVFNLVFAWLVFIVLSLSGIPTMTAKVGEVVKEKAAARAGMQKNDVIQSINGVKISSWDEIAAFITDSKGKSVNLGVKRGSEQLSFTITPEPHVAKNLFGEEIKRFAIGVVSSGEIEVRKYNPFQAAVKGTEQTWNVIKITVLSMVKLAQRVVPLDSIGGPIMIAKLAGEQASAGGSSFLAFMALLSVNLGILNLLPVPILDGGHLVFFFWELIFRRPVSQKAREYAQQVGLVLLVSLMVLAFYNDIVRYFFGKQG